MFGSHDVAYFFAGALLINAVPHIVCGVMGRPFQSPFATPSGVGLSSSTVNFLWGFLNLAAGYGLMAHIGAFDPHALDNIGALGLGMLLCGLFMARHFGRINGGNHP